jgi:hypothetical protein
MWQLSTELQSGLLRSRYELRSLSARHPKIFFPLVKLRGRNTQLIVTPQTDVVIEGFPRSGNTFAVAAFQFAQSQPQRIARHLHAPAQVIQAARWDLPTIVLVREPEEAILSLVLRYPFVQLRQALYDYIRFYTAILPYRDSFVVGMFDTVTNDFGRVIQELNGRFSTHFSPFEHTATNVEKVFQLVEEMDKQDTGKDQVSENMVARPSKAREAMKVSIKQQLEHETLKPLLRQAQQLYRQFREFA